MHFAGFRWVGRRVGLSPLNPPPPSRREGLQGVSNLVSEICRLQSLLRTPPCPQTLARKPGFFHFADPQTPKSQFSADLLPIENSSKIGLLKNPPEIAKSRSRIAKCRFRMDFGSHFGIIVAPLSIILPSFFPIWFWHRFWKDF